MSERRERRRGGQVLTVIVVVVVMYTSVFRGQDPMRERESKNHQISRILLF